MKTLRHEVLCIVGEHVAMEQLQKCAGTKEIEMMMTSSGPKKNDIITTLMNEPESVKLKVGYS